MDTTRAKYLIVLVGHREQAVRFPTSTPHAEMAKLLGLPVVSAGFCLGNDWAGGASDTLKLSSRGEQDRKLIASMLATPARETWDVVTLLQEQEQPPATEISFP